MPPPKILPRLTPEPRRSPGPKIGQKNENGIFGVFTPAAALRNPRPFESGLGPATPSVGPRSGPVLACGTRT